jgi:hypothetical protein
MTARKTVVASLLAFLATPALTGCATTPHDLPEPVVRTVEVKVATPVPCPALAALGDEPAYPDTEEAIKNAPSIGELARLYAIGRLMRSQRLSEYVAAKTGCMF